MKKILLAPLILLLGFYSTVSPAQDKEYRPGGEKFVLVWDRFYKGDHEPELADPLIEAGNKMTLVICEAIKNKDMRLRRYAIGALGHIGDEKALPTLQHIVLSKEEPYYLRYDALIAIYRIDRALAKECASQVGQDHKLLLELQKYIENEADWLTEP